MIITIDGPAASGKSSVARALAQKFKYVCVSSGLLYRAVAYVLYTAYNYNDQELSHPSPYTVAQIVRELEYRNDKGTIDILYHHSSIIAHLKTPAIDHGASVVSADPQVRHFLVEWQRALVKGHDAVVEGRDVGTVVFPDALCKIFLTARSKVRAERWQKDQMKRGTAVDFATAYQLVVERDKHDIERIHSPLKAAPDAWYFDTSDLSFDEVLCQIQEHVQGIIVL